MRSCVDEAEGPTAWWALLLRSTRLFVWLRCAAPLAELAQLDTFSSVRLVLRGDVISPLARLACERDRRSLVTHKYSLRLFESLQPSAHSYQHTFWLMADG
jgi:hypothetical protein